MKNHLINTQSIIFSLYISLFIITAAHATAKTAAPLDKKQQISAHILDITKGIPGRNIPIELHIKKAGEWRTIERKKTNHDGRISFNIPKNIAKSTYLFRLHFQLDEYFTDSFFPYAEVVFQRKPNQHYHVPLVVSPYAYSTYRGN